MSTRVTSLMMFRQFTKSLNSHLNDMGKVQNQLATGKRITKPSDDVIGLRGTMAYKVSLNDLSQYTRNIDEGIGSLALTESALTSMTHILERTRELALNESSDTGNDATREITNYEVRNLFNELVNIGNSKNRDKYLFSGYFTRTAAFDASGTYQGDSNNIDIYIGDGIKSRTNISGDVAFSESERLSTTSLTGQTLSGNLRITSGSGTPFYLEAGDVFSGASPEVIRDTVNAVMTGTFDSTVPEAVGTGTLTLKAGNGSPVTLTIDSTNDEPSQIRDAVNGLNMGITAGIFTDAAGNERLFFRSTTPGQGISIEVDDDDDNDTDTSGLSALRHTDLTSNLTSNALGIQALVIDDGTDKRLIFESDPAGTSFVIDVDEDNNGTWNEAADTDSTTGLSLLYHASASTSNLNNDISFFTIMDHLSNALTNNDSAGIEASILLLDGALDSTVKNTADIGSRLKHFDDQKFRMEDSEVSIRERLAVIEDADLAEAAMEMTRIQATLEAMRISSIQNLTQSLFNFLR